MDKPECPDCGSDDTEEIGGIRLWIYHACRCCSHTFAVRKPAAQVEAEREDQIREEQP